MPHSRTETVSFQRTSLPPLFPISYRRKVGLRKMKTTSKALLVGIVVIAGLFSLSFFASQGFAGSNTSQQSPLPSLSHFRGGMMGAGYYGTNGWGMMGGANSYGYYVPNYMWNVMNGAYGNFTSWCSQFMSRFFGS